LPANSGDATRECSGGEDWYGAKSMVRLLLRYPRRIRREALAESAPRSGGICSVSTPTASDGCIAPDRSWRVGEVSLGFVSGGGSGR